MDTKAGLLLSQLFAMTGYKMPTFKVATPLPEWKAKSRDNKPVMRAAPDKNSAHPGSVLGDKIRTLKSRFHLGKPRKGATLTNRQRVVIARAKRLGVTVTEYQSMFAKG